MRPVFQTGLTAVERKQTRLYDSTVFFFQHYMVSITQRKKYNETSQQSPYRFLIISRRGTYALVMTITDNARLLCSTLCFMHR